MTNHIKLKEMAKVKTSTTSNRVGKSKTKRLGVHSKTKSSKMKNSKNYKKSYCGQG
jgi:hypothetical protein